MQDKERLAVLETRMDQFDQNQKRILETQEEILKRITRYQGFIGGVMFVFSCLGIAATAVWEAFKHKFGA